MTSLNIVDLITNNPLTRLTDTHNNRFLEKVKSTFNESQQQLFIASFYSFLNYHKTDDYIIDLDNIWQWLGFNRKLNAKSCLEKNFILNKDYKNSICNLAKQQNFATAATVAKTTGSGGRNIEKFYLNIKTFKSLCLKAQTKKADEIHEYYIKLEELIQEVLEEEANEIKNKLLIKEELITQKDNELNKKEELISQKDNLISEKDNQLKNANQDKFKTVEKTIVSQFPVNNECIYFGTIDNSNVKGERLIKFGHSNNLPLRVQDHHKTYDNFILRDAFKVHNRQEIENAIKSHSKIKSHLRSIEVNEKNKHEILAYDATNFTINRLSRIIKDIIHEKTYSRENFDRLIEENTRSIGTIERLSGENERLKMENEQYQEQIAPLEQSLANMTEKYEIQRTMSNVSETQSANFDPDVKAKFDKFIADCCLIDADGEIDSTTIAAQFRIYNRAKPTRALFQSFNQYMRTRFLACRLQNKDQDRNGSVAHGYKGIALKPLEYKKQYTQNEVEDFLFENCVFSPNSRAATNHLIQQFIEYKRSTDLLINNNEARDMKNYLRNCEYIIGGAIRLHNNDDTFEGYYGISLKSDPDNDETETRISQTSSGKHVEKIDNATGNVLKTWTSIAKAALNEGFSTAKMSRAIKNSTVIGDAYYRV